MSNSERTTPRIRREKRTIRAMIDLYCRAHHAPQDGLCPDCAALMDYATRRLDCCPFGAEKPTCANCPIHCYKPTLREQVKAVMRYSGPRLLLRHPWLALMHQLDAFRKNKRIKRG